MSSTGAFDSTAKTSTCKRLRKQFGHFNSIQMDPNRESAHAEEVRPECRRHQGLHAQ